MKLRSFINRLFHDLVLNAIAVSITLGIFTILSDNMTIEDAIYKLPFVFLISFFLAGTYNYYKIILTKGE